MIKKLGKNIILLSAFFVAIILVSGSSISITLSNLSEKENLDFDVIEEETDLVDQLTGLDPNIQVNNPDYTEELFNSYKMRSKTYNNSALNMYGYIAYGGQEGPCWFEIDDPGNVHELAPTESNYFLAGGTWTCAEEWLCCEYNSGSLWKIDPDTGDMENIGGGGTSCNGLAWDPLYNRLYGASSTGLYEYDPDTGEQEYIGSFGLSGKTIIAIAIDVYGRAFIWDVLFSGSSTLWEVDLETGEATEVGEMGQNLLYAQDGAFEWETGILYLTAYSSSGFLATVDIKTGELTTIGDFEGGVEITASMIDSCCQCNYHDVGVYIINSPNSGVASEEIDVTIYVKNYGYYTAEDIQIDVVIRKYGIYEEYNETENIDKINPGETKMIEMPTWTPDDWHNITHQYIKYNITACTSLWDDYYPDNDKKEKRFVLYFGYIHDIEITSINSPCENGPGQAYPVQATITNIGQNTECCIPINIKIGDPTALETFLTENAWENVPPEGWYDEHKDFSNDYGWIKSNTSFSGGSSPEIKLSYYKAKQDHVFYSYAIDTSDYLSCQLEFLSYINHYSGSGLYALEAGYSHDGENWYATWHEEPSSSGSYEVVVPIEGGHETTYIGFWVKGNTYYFNYWYIDNVKLVVIGVEEEYSDSACQGDDLEPGESRTFEFDDWTPNYLQNETTDSIEYIIHAEIGMFGDRHPGNDIKYVYFTLNYWHDVGVVGGSVHYGNTLWDNGEPDGRNGLQGSVYYGYDNLIIDDMDLDADATAHGGQINLVWDSGAGIGNLDTLYMWFFEDEPGEDCEPQEDVYAMFEITEFSEILTGDYYFGRPEVEITVAFDDVEVPSGHSWVGFQPDSIGEDIAYLLTSKNKYCEAMADLPFWGYPRWTSSSDIWGHEYDISWKLTAYSCCPPPMDRYIQPGIESIDAVIRNHGTFKELNLTCTTQIWEFITYPYNGTKLYEDNVTNIDLDEPLGGTINLSFEDFTFEYEGRYDLIIELPDPDDDIIQNNRKIFGIGVDVTDPESSHELNPPAPDGENGWYVDDVEVTLEAYDPYSMDVSSGVDVINYRVNDGPIQIIEGNYYASGTFLITQADDGEDVKVEYWAIDNAGNEEKQHHTFTVDMDQTDPTIDLTYEVTGGNPKTGWDLLFTATVVDVTSGMDCVEFYLNDVLQAKISGPGPTYQWNFVYHGGLNLIVTAFGYDNAGNMVFDNIDHLKSTYYQSVPLQSDCITSSYFLNKPVQRVFGISEEGYK